MPREGTAMGAWSNAPLVYVIASVRFHPLPANEGEALAIYDGFSKSLYEHFPVRTDTTAFQLFLNPEKPEESRAEKTQACILTNKSKRKRAGFTVDHLFLDATEYTNSQDFINLFRQVITSAWSAIESSLQKQPQVSRIGLRYVDLIIPEPGASGMDLYLTSKLDLKAARNLAPIRTEWTANFSGNASSFDSLLKVKYIESLDKKVLPPDILGGKAPLTPGEVLHRQVSADGSVASLDFDHVIESDELPNGAEEIIHLLSSLKRELPVSIKDLATSHAIKTWGAT